MIRIEVPNNDLVALAEAGDMLLRIARQKAVTPSNEAYVAEAQRLTAERSAPILSALADVKAAWAKVEAAGELEEYTIVTEPAEDQTVYDSQAGIVDAGAAFGQPAADAERAGRLGGLGPDSGLEDLHEGIGVDPGAAFGQTCGSGKNEAERVAAERDLRASGVLAAIPTPTVELDNRGLPWDARIHASTRTKCKTGEWKNLKGVDKNVLATVEAELRAVMGAPHAATPPTPPVVLAATPPPEGTPVVLPAGPTGPTPPPAPAPTGTPSSFPEFLQIITAKCSAKLLTYNEVTATVQKHLGPTAGIPLLNARPDLIPAVYADLEAIWQTRS